jgi:hypothetical protein
MHDRVVTPLNALLRGELSAVRCYQRVLRRVPDIAYCRAGLEECLESHRGRAARLAIEVSRRGGTPIVQAGARAHLVGLTAALLTFVWFGLAARVLEIVEFRGIKRYDRTWGLLDASARNLLTACLFPQQVLSHQGMVLLNETVGSFAGTPTA